MRRFYLGTPEPAWLTRATVPLFVSRHRLRHRQMRGSKLPRAAVPWALDSGGFTVHDNPPHDWTITPESYVDEVMRYDREIGNLEWAAPMDKMCEPQIIEKTGLTVLIHQQRTVSNFLQLERLWALRSDDSNPIMPTLQGWDLADYSRCLDLYADAGVDLAGYDVVGLGSVCRREYTSEIGEIVHMVRERAPGIKLHGFGVKSRGIQRYGELLDSVDSQAWGIGARKRDVRTQYGLSCSHASPKCTWCLTWALEWRRMALSGTELAVAA